MWRAGGLNSGKMCSARSLSPKMSIRSSDSQQVYNGNTPHDFMVHLPKPLYLQGPWTVSLFEFNLSLNGEWWTWKRLKIIHNYRYQVPLRLSEFQDVSVYIRDASNEPASFLKGVTTVTLLLKKRLFEILKYSNGLHLVSDSRVWKTFYQNILDGQFRPGKYRGRQTRGGIGNMYFKNLTWFLSIRICPLRSLQNKS